MPAPKPKFDPLALSTIGVEFIAIFGLLLGGGWLLDHWWKVTAPWMTVAGAMLGFAAALYHLVRRAQSGAWYREEDDATRKRGDDENNRGA